VSRATPAREYPSMHVRLADVVEPSVRRATPPLAGGVRAAQMAGREKAELAVVGV